MSMYDVPVAEATPAISTADAINERESAREWLKLIRASVKNRKREAWIRYQDAVAAAKSKCMDEYAELDAELKDAKDAFDTAREEAKAASAAARGFRP